MPALIGPIGSVVNMNQAVNGNALGNPVYVSQLNVAESAALGGVAALIASYNSQLASSASAALATTVLNNMFVTTTAGVPAANVTALTAALTQAFDTYPTAKGQVISNLTTLLGNLESDANWGPAARAFNSQAAADYAYSSNTSNTNSGTPSAVTSYSLTTNIDVATSQSFVGVGSAAAGAITAASTTLNTGDTLTGSGSSSTASLTFANTAGGEATYVGTRFNSIPTISVTAVGTGGSTLDLSLATGLTSVVANQGTAAATFENVLQLAPLTVTSNQGAVTVNYNDSLVTTTAVGAVTLNGMIGVAGAAAGALDIGGVTASEGFRSVTVTTTGAASRLASLTTSNDNDLRTLTVTGSQGLRIDDVVSTSVSSLNMSGSTATNRIDIARAAAANNTATANKTTVVGGSGNDTVIFGAANLTTVDSVDLGLGVNTLGAQYTDGVVGTNTGISAALAAGINAAANVQQVLFNSDSAIAAGNATLDTADLGLINTMSKVIFEGRSGIFNNATGTAGTTAQSLAVTGVVAGEVLSFQDVSGAAGTAGAGGASGGAGAAGSAAVGGLSLASSVPFTRGTIELSSSTATDTTGIQIAGGAAGAGGVGANSNAGGVGGAAGAGITGLTNVSTLSIISNGGVTANSISGGAAGAGGNAAAGNAGNVGGAGGAAGVGINNAAGLNVEITGAYNLNIVGGAAGSAGTASGSIAGGAGGARAYGFAAAVNVDATAFTGNLNIEGSNVVTASDVIVSGSGSDTINGAGGADYITTGSGSDVIEYLTGGANEIGNTANGTQAQLGGLTDANNIETITGFASGTDDFRINTSAAFFRDDGGAGTEQVTFTATSVATVANVSLGNLTGIADIDALLAAVNAAVTATASTAGTLSSYLVTTGTVAGGLQNAANSTFLIVNNGVAAINNLDMVVKLVGTTSVAAGDYAFATV